MTFLKVIDTAAVAAYVVWCCKHPEYHNEKSHKRRLFLVHLAESLVSQQLTRRMANPQVMQRGVKLAFKALGFHNQPNAVEVTQSDGKQRCVICPRAVDRKTRTRCSECRNVCCQDHSSIVCDICHDNDWLHGIGRLVEVLLRTNKPPYIENTYIGFYSVHCSVVSFIVYVVSFMRQENSFCKKTLYPSIRVELY
jgi:hypothetical protein